MIHEIKALVRPEMLENVLLELRAIPGVPGIAVARVRGFGKVVRHSGNPGVQSAEVEMARIETAVPDALVGRVIAAIENAARTGHHGDGKIFVSPLTEVVRIRTGERGDAAL